MTSMGIGQACLVLGVIAGISEYVQKKTDKLKPNMVFKYKWLLEYSKKILRW